MTDAQKAFEGQKRRKANREAASRTEQERKQRSPAKRGTVSFGGIKIGRDMYPATKKENVKPEVLRTIKALAAFSGVDIVFYQSKADQRGDYVGANGFYHNGKIYIDTHAGANNTMQEDAVLLTAAHELTHFIRDSSPSHYETLKEFVTEKLVEQGYDFDYLVKHKMQQNQGVEKFSEDSAVEEVVADACEMVLKDSKAVQQLAEEKPSLFKRIRDWLKRYFADIKKAFEGVEARHEEAKAMTKYMDELVKLWDDAFTAAAKHDVGSKKIEKNKANVSETGASLALFSGRDVLKMDIAWDADNKSSLKSQITRHLEEVNSMHPVTNITYDRNSGKPYLEQLNDILRTRFNFKISRQDGVSFLFDKKAIESLGHYVGSDAEAAAVIASPYVLKRGKIISGHRNHKDGLYPSLTFAAPVTLNGKIGNVVVAVLFADKSRVHALRVLTPDNKEFVLEKKEADSEMGSRTVNAGLTVPTESASNKRISEIDQNVKFSAREVSPLSDSDYKKMEKHFGTTRNYNVAGYLLRDGKMLDFSGKHWGDTFSTERTVDHRDIWEVWEHDDLDGADEMVNMIGNGNIRLSPESGGLNLAISPNQEQIKVLRGYINNFGGEVIVDIDAVGGDTVESFAYSRGTASSKILNDIREYFENGTIPNTGSSLNQFRYSLRDSSAGLTAEEAREQSKAYTRLKAENAALQRRLDYWKGQTQKTKQASIAAHHTEYWLEAACAFWLCDEDPVEEKFSAYYSYGVSK